jgi:hypothetical protein
MWYSNPRKNMYFSTSPPFTDTGILSHRLPALRNPQHRYAVYGLYSQPLPHLVGHRLRFSNVLERISRRSCEPLYATNTSYSLTLSNICNWVFCPKSYPLRNTESWPCIQSSRSCKNHFRFHKHWCVPCRMLWSILNHELVGCWE